MLSKGIALVTGASQGIGLGRAIALRLANDGFNLAINDLPRKRDQLQSLSREIIEKGRKSCLVAGDVTIESEVAEMMQTVMEELGGLDVVSSFP